MEMARFQHGGRHERGHMTVGVHMSAQNLVPHGERSLFMVSFINDETALIDALAR